MPSKAKTTINRKRRKSKLMIDFMELMRDTTKFRKEVQYLIKHNTCSLRLFYMPTDAFM